MPWNRHVLPCVRATRWLPWHGTSGPSMPMRRSSLANTRLLSLPTSCVAREFRRLTLPFDQLLPTDALRHLPPQIRVTCLLRLPIDHARAELGITPLEPYRPMALEDIFQNTPGEAE